MFRVLVKIFRSWQGGLRYSSWRWGRIAKRSPTYLKFFFTCWAAWFLQAVGISAWAFRCVGACPSITG